MTYLLDDLAVTWIPAHTPFIFGTDLFSGLLPDEGADSANAIFEYLGDTGHDVFGLQNSGQPAISMPKIQVVSRDPDYTVARDHCWTIYRSLLIIANTPINGTLYQRVGALQDPFFLERDDTRRVKFACNFQIWKSN